MSSVGAATEEAAGPGAAGAASAPNRWIVLAAASLIMFAAGAMYAFSVFRDAVVEQRGLDLDQVMTAYSINMGLSPIPMLLGGWAIDRGHARPAAFIAGILLGGGWILSGIVTSAPMLWLTYGLMAGAGQGICYAVGLSNTLKFFPDRRGLAAGILTGVNGGATIVLAPIVSSLADRDETSMFVTMGVAYAALVLGAGWFVRPAPVAPAHLVAATGPDRGDLRGREIVRTLSFWLIFAIFVAGAFSGVMIAGNASPIGKEMFGLSAGTAALFVSLFAAASMTGRLSFGSASDRLGQVPSLMTVFALVTASHAVLVAGKGSATSYAIGLIGLGISYGGVMGLMPAVVMTSFGARHQGINYGLAFTAYSTAAVFAPKMAARIGEDRGGDYTRALEIAMVAAVIGLALSAALARVRRRASLG